MMLSAHDQKIALCFARIVLVHHVKRILMPSLEELGVLITPALLEKRGLFVTLFKNTPAFPKMLRGCIGTILPLQPIYEAVAIHTINAASRDARFLPVKENELNEIILEINVLTLPQAIDSYKKIRLGYDGIILSHGMRQALFLPKVPIEWGWNLEETLRQLSEKTGLPHDAWQSHATQFQIFQSESFSEKNL